MGGVIFAQSPVTGLPNQWSSLYHYDALQFSAGNNMYIGGRSSEGPITWFAYPGDVLGEFRYKYSNVDAAQLVYIPWNGHWSFRVSDNTISYGGLVNWRSIMTISRFNVVSINAADLKIHDADFMITNSGVNEFKVDKNGYVRCREVQVDLDPIPDYVFDPNYRLMPLAELRQYIQHNRHLPNIPSAAEYEEKGAVALGELNRLLLEKVEELTLYTLQLEENMQAMQQQLNSLQTQLSDSNHPKK